MAVAIPNDFHNGALLGRINTSQDEAKMPNEYAEKFYKSTSQTPGPTTLAD
jgi:hypothetical protein